jgi:DNA-binding NtrC family response regulator
LPEGILRIGSRPGVDLFIADPTVSGEHCEVEHRAGRVVVRDLGSKNGVWVQGVRVPEGELSVGQSMRLGRVVLTLVDGPADPKRAATEVLPGVVGRSAVMQRLAQRTRRLARSELSVLITGETGAGKELIARCLHELGDRREGPFVAVNCGALPDTLVEAELFGHRRGAFTGAMEQRTGLIEAAAGGTLFLDEIGELPLAQQPKLLRVLETRRVRRLGGERDRELDLRFVAATHASLEARVREGRFRQDLFYRISEASVRVPSLAERRSDIALLAAHFGAELAADPAGPPPPSLGALVLSELERRSYAGNVRELRSLIRRAAVLGWPEVLQTPSPFPHADRPEGSGQPSAASEPRPTYCEPLPNLQRKMILNAYEQAGGNKAEAARLLGMAKSTYADRLRRIEAQERRRARAGRAPDRGG